MTAGRVLFGFERDASADWVRGRSRAVLIGRVADALFRDV